MQLSLHWAKLSLIHKIWKLCYWSVCTRGDRKTFVLWALQKQHLLLFQNYFYSLSKNLTFSSMHVCHLRGDLSYFQCKSWSRPIAGIATYRWCFIVIPTSYSRRSFQTNDWWTLFAESSLYIDKSYWCFIHTQLSLPTESLTNLQF